MRKNVVLIVVHRDRIEIEPPIPEVIAGADPLYIAVQWSKDANNWDSLKLSKFGRPDKTEVETKDDPVEFFSKEGNVVKAVRYRLLERDEVLAHSDLECTGKTKGASLSGYLPVLLQAAPAAPRPESAPGGESDPPTAQKILDRSKRLS
jgi:hypothetical protein